jgi:hypothetical protein
VIEVTKGMIPQIVSRAKLVQEPKNFVRMRDQIDWELQTDEPVNRGPTTLTHIE